MKTSSTLRRRFSGAAVLVLALLTAGGGYAAFAPSGEAAAQSDPQQQITGGRELYMTGCSTCHGLQAQGTVIAPSLIGVGGAATYYQVSTGRMPLAEQGPQAMRKEARYTDLEVRKLSAYVQSVGGGPDIPTVDLAGANLQLGGELFRTNCASCHNFAGAGGALTYGKYAPKLSAATPTQIASAMLSGPESMPVFSSTTFDKAERDSIVRYIQYVTNAQDPGGQRIGHLGPIPEGLVAWLVGIGGLIAVTLWIGAKA